jgi:hypothetical protein
MNENDNIKIQFSNEFLVDKFENFEFDFSDKKKNLISVKLNNILNEESIIKFKYNEEMKISCEKCASIISYLSRKHSENEWICEICSHINETNILDWTELINVDDIEFNSEEENDVLDNSTEISVIKEKDERILIFCIDTSGSMAGSRINSVKEACLKIVELLCRHEQHDFKLVLITFDSTSKYYGNGKNNLY